MLKVFSVISAKQGKHNNKAYPNPIIVRNLFRTKIKWRALVTKDWLKNGSWAFFIQIVLSIYAICRHTTFAALKLFKSNALSSTLKFCEIDPLEIWITLKYGIHILELPVAFITLNNLWYSVVRFITLKKLSLVAPHMCNYLIIHRQFSICSRDNLSKSGYLI